MVLSDSVATEEGDALETALAVGLSANDLAKKFAGIYEYRSVSDEKPDGSREETLVTQYFIYNPTSEHQGQYYAVYKFDDGDARVGDYGNWNLLRVHELEREYLAELNCSTSLPIRELVKMTKLERDLRKFQDSANDPLVTIHANGFVAKNALSGKQERHVRIGDISDEVVEPVEIDAGNEQARAVVRLKSFPDVVAE